MQKKTDHGIEKVNGCGFHLRKTCQGCQSQGHCKIEKWLNAEDLVIEGDRYVIAEKVTVTA